MPDPVSSKGFARRRWMRLLTLLVACSASPALPADDGALMAVGKRLYLEGVLPSGQALEGHVAGSAPVRGLQAACVGCHRRSGLGVAEGPFVIRPLTVPGFFAGQANTRRYARPHGVKVRQLQYTQEAFARALRDGRSADGRELSALMPRYMLDDDSISALQAYLSELALRPAPGVTDDEIHFATIIAPDAEPKVRDATLQMLGALVDTRNAGTRSEQHRKRAGVESMHVDWRRWTLHVWELTGEPDTWAAQLEERYRTQPVFAVLSGAGGRWQPVHDFCEGNELPCLFPNVDVPGRAEAGAYTLYLSRGVLLEAEVMAAHLAGRGWTGRVRQVWRNDEHRAAAGARAFAAAWQQQGGGQLLETRLQPGDALEAALPADESAAWILWLDRADLARLDKLTAVGDGPLLASGTLIGEPHPLESPAVDPRLSIIWPFALPAADGRRVDRVQHWMKSRGMAAGDWRTQVNTYFASTIVNETVIHMANNYSREYLIERIEHGADRSLATGAYPRIGLGPGQRFASKGAYVARFVGAGLRAQTDWIVP